MSKKVEMNFGLRQTEQKRRFPPTFHYFPKLSQLLLKITPVGQVGQVQYEKILPNRKFFSPVILYQDKTNLLIAANINYNSPLVSVQGLNAKGQIKWTLPPKGYKFELATKCKQGYAINYRLGETDGIYHFCRWKNVG